MENASRTRDIIKNITIVFLAVMLILTFFSSTILNRSLPEVAAQYAYGGQITSSVRANGMTEANENYEVIIEEGRVIQYVNVRRGDKVQAGDILFLLEDQESSELQAAMDQLNEAKKSYEKWKLQVENDIEDQKLEIRYAKEDLDKVRARGVSKIDTSAQEKKIKDLTKELAGYSLNHAQMDYDEAFAALTAAQDVYDKAEANVEAQNEELERRNDVLAEMNDTLGEKNGELAEMNQILAEMKQNSPEHLQSQILSAKRSLEDMNINLTRAEEVYNGVKAEYDEASAKVDKLAAAMRYAKNNYEKALGDISIVEDNIAFYNARVIQLSAIEDPTEEQLQQLSEARMELAYNQSIQGAVREKASIENETYMAAKSEYDQNQSLIERDAEQMKTMEQRLEDDRRTIARAEEDLNAILANAGAGVDEAAIAAYEAKVEEKEAEIKDHQAQIKTHQGTIKNQQNVIKDAGKELAAAQEALSEAEGVYRTAKDNLTAAKASAKSNGETYTEEELEKLVEETEIKLEKAKEELERLQSQTSDGYPSMEAYKEAITAAERQLENLNTRLTRTKESNDLDEPGYTTAIERAQKEVDRLTETVGEAVIKAKVGGTVSNIRVSAGQKVDAQTTLAEIEQVDKGYSVTLSLTAEQAKRIAVGQSATILYYWGNTPDAVVESIKPDKSDPQNRRIVTLHLTGDVTAGQSFTFSLGEKSTNYDTIVPNSAIREDANGKFVLTVSVKSTPVGNRYTAQRTDIEVIASDETSTAVSGLAGGEFVITTSATPIAPGQQVRLPDNT
ncbi:MAG: HlyD family efflux transporter periplasmic adaptor subunit [Clostridia bacterium]|nr:HlyD family efflux transporter periplasmic adaptor subunit [Clostridia bacterium]